MSCNLNQLEIRFDELRQELISKLHECNDCIQTAKNLSQQSTETTTVPENTSINEKEWKDIKLKLATTLIKGKVILDVGGEKYTTSIDTLTRENNTFFTALFSKQWILEQDPDDKSIFIDRNGKIFTYILEYLRTNVVPNNVMQDEILLQSLFIEAEYFRLHTLINILKQAGEKHQKEKGKEENFRANKYFPNGTLLQLEYKKKLNKFYGEDDQQWELIYKASRDGFDANAFHTRCNNRGPTITIVLTNNNYLFGGYTSIPWTSDGSKKNDTGAFIFTLTNPHNISPTKYLIHPGTKSNAVSHNSEHGPTFGGGHDIYVSNGSNANNSNYTNFPYSYADTTGKGYATFTGTYDFIVSDIEVFKLA